VHRTPPPHVRTVLLLLAAALPAAGQVAKIPDVKSLDELRILDAATVLDTWDVRVGLVDPGAEAGPWRLLCCHLKYIGPPDGSRRLKLPSLTYVSGRLLGPVSYTVDPANAKIHHAAGKVLRTLSTGGEKDTERLYVGAVPLALTGEWRLTVWSAGPRPIAMRVLKVPADRRCQWRVFARLDQRRAGPGQPAIVHFRGDPAMPVYPHFAPIWRSDGSRSVKTLTPLPGKIGFLPGRLPPWPQYEPRYYGHKLRAVAEGQYPYPLKLSLEAGSFVLRSEAPMVDRPEELLLARWWIDGKPVDAKPPSNADRLTRDLARQIRHVRQMKVGFRLPDDVRPLKPGTKVTVQVMYSQAGYNRVWRHRGRMLRAALPGWPASQPMLSNHLTFPVDKKMLAGRLGR